MQEREVDFKGQPITLKRGTAMENYLGLSKIKMVATDLDGTFLDNNSKIPDLNRKTWLFLKHYTNVVTSIATGRGFHNSKRFAHEIQSDYLVTDNGAAIFKRGEDGEYELAKSFAMEKDTCEDIFNKMQECGKGNSDMVYHLSTPEEFLIAGGKDQQERNANFKKAGDKFYPGEQFGEGVVQIDDIGQINSEQRKKLIKMCVDFGSTKAGMDKFEEFLKQNKGIEYFITSDSKIEIAPKGIHKGVALSEICKMEKEKGNEITRDQVAPFGDSGNDTAMLSKFLKHGRLMPNASKAVKNFLKEITIAKKHNHEAGVSHATEELTGIKHSGAYEKYSEGKMPEGIYDTTEDRTLSIKGKGPKRTIIGKNKQNTQER
jgi:hypothetical protein